MAKQLKNIINIRLQAKFNPFFPAEDKHFHNYFRTFKKAEETLEGSYFCSPFFANGDILPFDEHYDNRIKNMTAISETIHGKECLYIYLVYDFRFAAVNEEYYTDGEFAYIKNLIGVALLGTGLYLCFMASHFNQIATYSPLALKAEHYHILIDKEAEMDKTEYDAAINRFADNLKKTDWIDVEFQ